MSDMIEVCKPKSDQLNADDLIGNQLTIKIRDVKVNKNAAAQKVAVYYDGDNNKPYKPSKGMCRVLLQIWGKDEDKYIGHSLTLFREPTVVYAGDEVGGIQISHMTGITKPTPCVLTVSNKKKKIIVVNPLVVNNAAPATPPVQAAAQAKPVLTHQQQIDALLVAFDGIGVTHDMLEAQQGCASVSFDMPALRKIYTEIKSGEATVDKYFAMPNNDIAQSGEPDFEA